MTLIPPSASIPTSLSPRSTVYIRATKTHTRDGKTAKSYRLSRSVRIGAKVRQETLLNLGVDYPVPKQQWRDVALVTELLLAGQRPMLPVPSDIQVAAEDLVRRTSLPARGGPGAAGAGEEGPGASGGHGGPRYAGA